jgi:hypothetical protein
MEVEAEVPESRQVTLTLPAGVPTGRVRLTVTVDAPGPDVFPPYWPHRRPADPATAVEYDAFQRMLPELIATHYGQYVAVCQGRLTAAAALPDEARRQAEVTAAGRPVYVGLVLPPGTEVIRIGGIRILDEQVDG